MPIDAKINIRGMEEELERIVRLGRDIDASADRALDKGSDVLVAGMTRRAPRRTGNLVNSIKKFAFKDNSFHRVTVRPDLGEELADYGQRVSGIMSKKADKATGQHYQLKSWGRSNLYPVYVEHGTKSHGKERTKAVHYAENTRDQDAGTARNALRESLKKDGMI